MSVLHALFLSILIFLLSPSLTLRPSTSPCTPPHRPLSHVQSRLIAFSRDFDAGNIDGLGKYYTADAVADFGLFVAAGRQEIVDGWKFYVESSNGMIFSDLVSLKRIGCRSLFEEVGRFEANGTLDGETVMIKGNHVDVWRVYKSAPALIISSNSTFAVV